MVVTGVLIAESLRTGARLEGDFRSATDTYVVFSQRVFRYPRGDAAGRDEAEAHARSVGVPESQLDWPE